MGKKGSNWFQLLVQSCFTRLFHFPPRSNSHSWVCQDILGQLLCVHTEPPCWSSSATSGWNPGLKSQPQSCRRNTGRPLEAVAVSLWGSWLRQLDEHLKDSQKKGTSDHFFSFKAPAGVQSQPCLSVINIWWATVPATIYFFGNLTQVSRLILAFRLNSTDWTFTNKDTRVSLSGRGLGSSSDGAAECRNCNLCFILLFCHFVMRHCKSSKRFFFSVAEISEQFWKRHLETQGGGATPGSYRQIKKQNWNWFREVNDF